MAPKLPPPAPVTEFSRILGECGLTEAECAKVNLGCVDLGVRGSTPRWGAVSGFCVLALRAPLSRPPTAQTTPRAVPVMGLPRTSGWSPMLVDKGVSRPHTNANTPTHYHGCTEAVGGRSKACSLYAAHRAACGSSWKRPMKSGVSQRPHSANRRELP